MALSVLNKNFLAALNKLDIDVKQFPDKTFDGSFDFVPDSMCHFFNWFIENVTPENSLTQTERATYFLLESTQSLPTEEEMNYVLSSCRPSYEELMFIDVNRVNNYLPKELDDLKQYQENLSDIYENMESNCDGAKKKQIILKEKINSEKQKLAAGHEGFYKTKSYFKATVNEVKMFLLKQPDFHFSIDLLSNILTKEEDIFNKLESYKLLENDISDSLKSDLLAQLEEDLVYIEVSSILTKGFLQAKKVKINFLSEYLQKKSHKSSNYNWIALYSGNKEGMDAKISEEIKFLESKLFETKKNASHTEVEKILEDYLCGKTDLYMSYTSILIAFHEYIKLNWKLSSCLLHILLRCNIYLEKMVRSRKPLYSKLNEYETQFNNDIMNLELRQQRFTEMMTHQNKHPFLLELDKPNCFEDSLKNIFDLISRANECSDAVAMKNQLQSSIKSVFRDTLCGPTDELLLVPMELLVEFQDKKDRVKCLSQAVKRLASKYVETKEKISKQQRKELLAWINCITNPQAR